MNQMAMMNGMNMGMMNPFMAAAMSQGGGMPPGMMMPDFGM